ncbi:MAG TPA: phytanoyl-CoA dioxygenase family protein [Edaphobacter sp.]|nr:phytanoyl-CoA dioxygenase family protein [Edaphobacter sp.]
MKSFREMKANDLTSSTLQEEIDSRGYALIRGLLPYDDITQLLGKITQILSVAGWLLPGPDPLARIADLNAVCGDPDPAFKHAYHNVFNLELFHALPHHPALQHIMKMLVGNRLLIHPKPIGRLIFPHCEQLTVHAHQDYRFMGGDPECFTVWIPLHNCPVSVGPLRVVEGSHRLGYIHHEDEHLHVPEIPETADLVGDWVGGPINVGDVLIFHSLTVHAASPNLSNQLRISLDCRFQDYGRVLNPANLVFAGDSGKSWEKTYAGWCSDDLKYYWKGLPLELQPSKVEIEQLSKTADSPAKRARFDRMLSQLN